MTIQSYPIQWPEEWPRTPPSKRWGGLFETTFAKSRDQLLNELRLLGATGVVISSDVQVRRDGLPLAKGGWKHGDDPGIAVYFTLQKRRKAIACDTYSSPEANMRALCLSVEALRALGRHGVTGMLERAFQGFEALPAPGTLDWRLILGFRDREEVSIRSIEAHYRTLAMRDHPDSGGSDRAMARLNTARELALKEVNHV